MERRLRPIAPKPMQPPPPLMPMGATASSVLWRARKRGREDHLLLPAAMSKREREATSSSSYPYYPPAPVLPAAGAGYMPMPEALLAGCEERLRRLSLVAAGSPAATASSPWPAAAPSSDATRRAVPVERDLISKLGKLQVPNKVIKPRPARPLCTTICIDSSSIAVGGGVAYPETVSVSNKTAREVEAELELPGALPAVVSGRHNSRVTTA